MNMGTLPAVLIEAVSSFILLIEQLVLLNCKPTGDRSGEHVPETLHYSAGTKYL